MFDYMIIKFINPVYGCSQIMNITDAFIANNISEDGVIQKDFVMMVNGDDANLSVLCIEGLSFVALNELMNELYENGKIDLSSNVDAKITICSREFLDLNNVNFDDLNLDGFEYEDDDE